MSSWIACRTASYRPFEHLALPHLAPLGVRFVEIPLPRREEWPAVRDELAKHGLSASSLHGECDIRQDDLATRIEAQMPAFAEFGCRYLFVSVKAEDLPRERAYAQLRAAGEIAARHGVTIVLETHPDLATNAATVLATMSGVNHPAVRINFDTANICFYNEGADPAAELQAIAPYVAAIHLKDTDGGYRHWHFPALGQGVVDFPQIFQILDETGFQGPSTLEIEGIEGEQKTEDLICGRIVESINFLRKIGRFEKD